MLVMEGRNVEGGWGGWRRVLGPAWGDAAGCHATGSVPGVCAGGVAGRLGCGGGGVGGHQLTLLPGEHNIESTPIRASPFPSAATTPTTHPILHGPFLHLIHMRALLYTHRHRRRRTRNATSIQKSRFPPDLPTPGPFHIHPDIPSHPPTPPTSTQQKPWKTSFGPCARAPSSRDGRERGGRRFLLLLVRLLLLPPPLMLLRLLPAWTFSIRPPPPPPSRARARKIKSQTKR